MYIFQRPTRGELFQNMSCALYQLNHPDMIFISEIFKVHHLLESHGLVGGQINTPDISPQQLLHRPTELLTLVHRAFKLSDSLQFCQACCLYRLKTLLSMRPY